MFRGFALAVLALTSACGHSIGDSCTTNVDCSPLGDRFCDVAPPGGYCTIEDCGPTSCPSEAACIRFFTPILNETCTLPKSSDSDPLPVRADCTHADEVCVCDNSMNGQCQTPKATTANPKPTNGHCAPTSTEKHWCEKLCGNNGDCRQGYECRETGTLGATPLPSFDMQGALPEKFCAPIEPGNPPISTI
jgi:hypothetical protein